MEIKIDQDSFETTARVLAVVNAGIVNYDYCLKMMTNMVHEYGPESAYFGTAGFYIVCFTEELPFFDEMAPDEQIGVKKIRHAKAVLMPFTVERYLKEKGISNG